MAAGACQQRAAGQQGGDHPFSRDAGAAPDHPVSHRDRLDVGALVALHPQRVAIRVAAFDLEQCTTVHHHQADLLIALAGQRLVHGLPPNPVTLVTVDAAALLLGQMALAHVVEAEITGESRR